MRASAVAFGRAARRRILAFGARLRLELEPRANRRARLAMLAQLGLEIRVHQDGLSNLVSVRKRSYAERRRETPLRLCNGHGYHFEVEHTHRLR